MITLGRDTNSNDPTACAESTESAIAHMLREVKPPVTFPEGVTIRRHRLADELAEREEQA